MAFYCTLNDETCHAEVFRRGNEYAVIVKVGYDGTGDKGYSIVAGFSPCPPGDLEFYFCLVEADSEADEERQIFDALEVAQIVDSKEDRQKILEALTGAAKLLVENVRPPRFVMATRDGNLPQKALNKYLRLIELFSHLGYTITGANQYNGISAWWADLGPATSAIVPPLSDG